MEEFVLHLALTLVKLFIKNPGRAAIWKTHLIELHDEIEVLYPDVKR